MNQKKQINEILEKDYKITQNVNSNETSNNLKKYLYENIINNKEELKVKIVSDIHIDHWDSDYISYYPYGEVKNNPLNLLEKGGILIVAGDISDDINMSIDFLDKISNNFEKILFVDGNHEHCSKYPYLYDLNFINNKVMQKNNEKLIYLPNNDYIINNTVFIGYCGWWDYNNSDIKAIEKNHNYFDNWFNNFKIKENKLFIDNVIEKAEEEYNLLKSKINQYENDENIENIIIVTHTVPIIKFCDELKTDTEMNTKYKELIKSKKINYWLFGHTHHNFNEEIEGIRYICNPRGRPNDFNREFYNEINITL
jgi:DNA repair exonuclease SbcCD nuclease subunit